MAGAPAQTHRTSVENEQINRHRSCRRPSSPPHGPRSPLAQDLLGETTYARVDLVTDDDGMPVVLELELLDPALFLDTDPAAASRFAHVLQQLIA